MNNDFNQLQPLSVKKMIENSTHFGKERVNYVSPNTVQYV